jgi:hypothetical protein
MEAARTASMRGHHVVLFEARPRLGGALNIASLAPAMQGFEDIADWLRQEVGRLGVEVHTNTYVEATDVLAERPHCVIVASGALPHFDGRLIASPGEPVVGYDQPHVVSTVDVLTRQWRDLGRHALVYDDLGSYEAVAIIEFLLAKGVAVTAATRHPTFGGLVDAGMRMEPALQRLHRAGPGLRVHMRAQLLRVETGKALLRDSLQGSEEPVPADTVVVVTPKMSLRSLADQLSGAVDDIRLVGDALSARDLQVAIREGHMAGREIR